MGKLFKPTPPPEDGEASSLGSQLIWFVGISICGVLIVAGTAYGLRKLLFL